MHLRANECATLSNIIGADAFPFNANASANIHINGACMSLCERKRVNNFINQ